MPYFRMLREWVNQNLSSLLILRAISIYLRTTFASKFIQLCKKAESGKTLSIYVLKYEMRIGQEKIYRCKHQFSLSFLLN